MINTGKLAGCTIFITGASRGIGKSIALKAAQDGANIILAAKTAQPHPKLPGTIYSAAEEVEKAGGKALPCIVDVRDEAQVASAVQSAVDKFGGIDVVVNNASAISLTGTLGTEMKKFDLMHQINTRGTFLVSKLCLPHLLKSKNPHIINLSPPLNMHPIWFKNHVAYTMAKYGMSMCVLGMAEEFKDQGVAVNALWPKTSILTAAMEMLAGDEAFRSSRKPEIVADAAYAIMCKDSKTFTGKFLVDEDVLKAEGITDFVQYACDPSNVANLMLDFFLDINDIDPRMIEKEVKKHQGTSAGSKATTGGSAGSGGKIELIFSAIDKNLSPELVSSTGAIYQFNVKGDDAGTWYLDLKNGGGSLGKGEPPNCPADATLTMDSANFYAMFSGKLKPATAFMMGKLKVTGNIQKAMKLEKLMVSLKSKL